MRFGILGPLLVCDGDVVVDVPAARQRALLAALVLHAGFTGRAPRPATRRWHLSGIDYI
jgi:DNA-binding SARP family transcriptional activator